MEIVGTVRVVDRDRAGALEGVVRLENVDLADAPSRVVASTPVTLASGERQSRFRLQLDHVLDARGHYIVTALLEGEDPQSRQKRQFGTTVAYPWDPPGSPADISIEARPWN